MKKNKKNNYLKIILIAGAVIAFNVIFILSKGNRESNLLDKLEKANPTLERENAEKLLLNLKKDSLQAQKQGLISKDSTVEEKLKFSAELVNKNTPLKIDEITFIEKATADKMTITYNYKIIKEIEKEESKKLIIKNVCDTLKDRMWRLSDDIIYKYSYRLNDDKDVYMEFEVRKSDCK